MPRKKNWRIALAKRESRVKDDIRLVDSGHVKNRASDLGDTASLKRVQNLPSGTRNSTSLPSGSSNITDLPSGFTNTTALPSGCTNTTDLPSGSTNTTDLKIENMFLVASNLEKKLPSGSLNRCNEILDMNLCKEVGETNLQIEVQKCLSKSFSVTRCLPSSCVMSEESSQKFGEGNLEYSRQMIFGSFHQGNARFSLFFRGSRFTCMALTMLLKCYEEFSFTSEFLDQTIIAGDQIYKTVVQSLQKQKTFQHKHLKFDELPQNVTLGENHHFIQKFELIWGLVVCEQQSQIKTLHQSIAEGFELSRYLLIMLGSICSVLYKASSSEYYFFDSHSHSFDGMSCSYGKSILVLTKSIDGMVSYLYSMYESMHIDLATQFEILPLSIRTLCHSFPCEDQCQKRYCRLDKIPTVSKFVDQNQSRKTYMREYMRGYIKKKRESEKFRQAEKLKDVLAKNLARKNDDVREKKKGKRQNCKTIKKTTC